MEWQQNSLAHCHATLCTCLCVFSQSVQTLDLSQIWVCMSEIKGYSDHFWCPATLSKLGSCQCWSEIMLQTPPTPFSYPDVIITSRCMIFLTRVCNSATCCVLHSARNLSYGTTQGCSGSLPRHFGSVIFFPPLSLVSYFSLPCFGVSGVFPLLFGVKRYCL